MQLVREHLLYPRIYADDFGVFVDIVKEDTIVGRFGFYILHIEDVCDGILFRVTQIGRTTMFDFELLHLYHAVVRLPDVEIIIVYDEKDFSYKQKTKKTKQIKT